MNIYVKTYNEIAGFHRWPDAPEHLKFLSYPHRHIFHIITTFSVSHNDREIEIIETQNEIEDYVRSCYTDEETGDINFESMSCEMLATHILTEFGATKCEVLEDGKGGAIVVRE